MTDEEIHAESNLLRRTKHNANNDLIRFLNSLTQDALNTYPQAEMQTWPYQKLEADALAAAGAGATLDMAPVIAAVCVAHFGPADDATRLEQVIEKAGIVRLLDSNFMAGATYVNGLRARTQDLFGASDDPAEVTAILEAAMAEALSVMPPVAA